MAMMAMIDISIKMQCLNIMFIKLVSLHPGQLFCRYMLIRLAQLFTIILLSLAACSSNLHPRCQKKLGT